MLDDKKVTVVISLEVDNDEKVEHTDGQFKAK